jgi:hypothetical protein
MKPQIQNEELLTVEAGGTYSYHLPQRVKAWTFYLNLELCKILIIKFLIFNWQKTFVSLPPTVEVL